MLIQRSIPIILERSDDLLTTVEEFNRYQKNISVEAFNEGTPKNALSLHKSVYHSAKSTLNSQMRCSAIRLVAGAYASAKSNNRSAKRPFIFRRKRALFLIGNRGRDASFAKNGKISIWTTAGRKKLGFRVPDAFLGDFENAVTLDSLNVGAGGKGSLCITIKVEEPKGLIPVGIDLGIRNALVASTRKDTFIISGISLLKAGSVLEKPKLEFNLRNPRKRNWAKIHALCVVS